jgi:hypothetical protein
MAALLFIPAWTLDYWQAWTFLAVYFASSLAITLYLMKKDPKLLERRMSGGPTAEKQTTQSLTHPIFIRRLFAQRGISDEEWLCFELVALIADRPTGFINGEPLWR